MKKFFLKFNMFISIIKILEQIKIILNNEYILKKYFQILMKFFKIIAF